MSIFDIFNGVLLMLWLLSDIEIKDVFWYLGVIFLFFLLSWAIGEVSFSIKFKFNLLLGSFLRLKKIDEKTELNFEESLKVDDCLRHVSSIKFFALKKNYF